MHTYAPANIIFDGPITNPLSVLCVFVEIQFSSIQNTLLLKQLNGNNSSLTPKSCHVLMQRGEKALMILNLAVKGLNGEK